MNRPVSPEAFRTERFDSAEAAVQRLQDIYNANTARLRDAFRAYVGGTAPARPVRACYPYVSITVSGFSPRDTLLSYGFVDRPGTFATTVTRPDLFRQYFLEQIGQLIRNHRVAIEVGVSETPIPVHFAFPDLHVEGELTPESIQNLRNLFDLPDLAAMDDNIVNGTAVIPAGVPHPLALFTGPRVDYSLFRLKHYTATAPEHFQNFVLFTNYQFYIDEFVRTAQELMRQGGGDYALFVEPGDRVTRPGEAPPPPSIARLPQMPAYHLTRPDHSGITMVNIGIGP